MNNSQPNLIYALQREKLVHISQVERGLKCDCLCPACDEKLVAKKGNKVMHHFSHHSEGSCQYGYQTSLHLAAKEIIGKAKHMWVPEVLIKFDSYRKSEVVREAMDIQITDIKFEKALGDIIPDILIVSGKRTYLVEIVVTHPIDDIKLEKIKKLNISTLEVDLRKLDTSIIDADLYDILIGSSSLKRWKYSAAEKVWKERFLQCCEKYKIIERGRALHIDHCPMRRRIWRGKPYANFMDDCTGCNFFIAKYRGNQKNEYDNGGIFCSGKARVAEIKDFSLSVEDRWKKYCEKHRQEMGEAIDQNACPLCGSELKLRNGSFGVFLGCSSYPHCRFTLSIDSETGEIIK